MKTTATTPATTPATTAQVNDCKGKPRQPRQKPARTHAHMRTPTHPHTRARAHVYPCRGCRGLSDIKELQHFCRGFWRGFSDVAVVSLMQVNK
jgi:hypothetical protein